MKDAARRYKVNYSITNLQFGLLETDTNVRSEKIFYFEQISPITYHQIFDDVILRRKSNKLMLPVTELVAIEHF